MKFFLSSLVFIFFFNAIIFNRAMAVTTVDIYGPGQNIVNFAIATPLVDPEEPAKRLGADLNNRIKQNLSFLPFMRLVPEKAVLGGIILTAWLGNEIDFKRFQIAGADLLMTSYWKDGDRNGKTVEIRIFETYSGKFVFGNAYSNVTEKLLDEVANTFCYDLMKALTGNGDFFKASLAFAKNLGDRDKNIWLVSPTGKNLRKITNLDGVALSPAWSPDGRYVVFSHIDDSSHALGIWQTEGTQVRRIRFPGNTVIGPSFMPDNKVAVSLSTGTQPDIFLLNHRFEKERTLESSPFIEVSPSFDNSGKKMVFTSSRLGGPQVFLKDFNNGSVTRVSKSGSYNSEPSISPDGTLVAYTKSTDDGFRIFVHDLQTGFERQVSFGPGRDEQPAFAPDSYFLAYVSDRTGTKKIYLTTRHGGDPKAVPTGSGEATFPTWGILPK